MTSRNTFPESLLKLQQAAAELQSPRTVILGVGNELNGDDAAGIICLRAIKKRLSHRTDLLLIDGGHAPENYAGAIVRFSPDLILILDAVKQGLRLGEIALISADELDGVTFSTHTLPLNILINYLRHELNCRILLIGIQVEQTEAFTPISTRLRRSAQMLARQICQVVSSFTN